MSRSLAIQGVLCIGLAISLPALDALDEIPLGVEPKAVEELPEFAGPVKGALDEAPNPDPRSATDDYCPYGA